MTKVLILHVKQIRCDNQINFLANKIFSLLFIKSSKIDNEEKVAIIET